MERNIFLVSFISLLMIFCGCTEKKMFTASGTIEIREVDLSSRISSRVEQFFSDEGATVKKGDLLAQLETGIVSAQKDIAEAVFTQAERNFKRSQNLIKSGTITPEQFETSKTQYIKAVSDLKLAEIMLKESNIYAPWDGVILKKNVEVGELIAPNTPIFTLGDLSVAEIMVYVPLMDIGKIKLNQPARIYADPFPNERFTGKVTNISEEAEFTPKNVQTKDERVKEVFAVKIKIPNPDLKLKPGMPADVEVFQE